MTDDEARALYTELLGLLREQGLVWIAEQIENEVALGRPDKKQVDEVDHLRTEGLTTVESWDEHVASRHRQRTRKVEFPATVEFSPQERVRLTLEALRSGVVIPTRIADELVAFAEREIGNGRIVFARPVDGANPDAVVDVPLVRRHVEAAQRLQASLDALAKEL